LVFSLEQPAIAKTPPIREAALNPLFNDPLKGTSANFAAPWLSHCDSRPNQKDGEHREPFEPVHRERIA
jgi:hypothetical protein